MNNETLEALEARNYFGISYQNHVRETMGLVEAIKAEVKFLESLRPRV